MITDLLAMQERILQAVERNTEAILANTAAIRELAAPEQRVSGDRGIESGEEVSRKGRVTRTK